MTRVETITQLGITVTIISSFLIFNVNSTLEGNTIQCGTNGVSSQVNTELSVPGNSLPD